MATVLKFKRGLSSAWTEKNPILEAGEPGFELDTSQVKIGDGTTAWNELDYLGGSSEELENILAVLENKANKDNVYTKDEIDTMITSVYVYKGSVNNYSDLPTSGQKIGDAWNIKNADKMHGVKAGDNVVWDGNDWDVHSGDIDLSEIIVELSNDLPSKIVTGDPIIDIMEEGSAGTSPKAARADHVHPIDPNLARSDGKNAFGTWLGLSGGVKSQQLGASSINIEDLKQDLQQWDVYNINNTGADHRALAFKSGYLNISEDWIDMWNNNSTSNFPTNNKKFFGIHRLSGSSQDSVVTYLISSENGLYYTNCMYLGDVWSKIIKISDENSNSGDELAKYALANGSNATGFWSNIQSLASRYINPSLGRELPFSITWKSWIDQFDALLKEYANGFSFEQTNITSEGIQIWNNRPNDNNLSDLGVGGDTSNIIAYFVRGSTDGQNGLIILLDPTERQIYFFEKKNNKWGNINPLSVSNNSSEELELIGGKLAEIQGAIAGLMLDIQNINYYDLQDLPEISQNISEDSNNPSKLVSPQAVVRYIDAEFSEITPEEIQEIWNEIVNEE